MTYYVLGIVIVCYFISSKFQSVWFFGLLLSVTAFHIFMFFSFYISFSIFDTETEFLNAIIVGLIFGAFIAIGVLRPTVNSNRWLWQKKD